MALNPQDVLKRFIPPVSGEVLREFQQLRFGPDKERIRSASEFFATQLPSEICQGDIVGLLPLLWYDDDGQRYEEEVWAMLISPSCDFDNDPTALFAPCFPASRFVGKRYYSSIVAQETASLFYIAPTASREAFVADLSNIQPVPTATVATGLASKALSRISSFTPLGHVGMLLKLTHHLMRQESSEVVRNRSELGLRDRFNEAISQIIRLPKFVLFGNRS